MPSRTFKTKKRVRKDNKNNKLAGVRKIIVEPQMTNTEIEAREGQFFDTNDYPGGVYSGNIDCYIRDPTTKKLRPLFKLRKAQIPQDNNKQVWNALSKFAMKWNDNRGAAAGIISSSQLPAHARNIVRRDKFRVLYRDAAGHTKKGHISNRVRSNIIGYYDMPDRNRLAKSGRAPKCRPTAWVRDHPKEWVEGVIPIVKSADASFKRVLAKRHGVQLARARKTPDFQIADTAYSTVTVNYNYRSACHRDAGDLEEGFGNLIVVDRHQVGANASANVGEKLYPYKGGYLGFPQYGVMVDVKQGDYLAMDVHEWHCNTPIICGCPKGEKCPNSERDKHCGRMSLVFYLRKGMLKCAE